MKHVISILIVTIGWSHGTLLAQEPALKKVYQIGNDIQLRMLIPGVYLHQSFMNVPSWGRVGANGLVVVSGNEALLIDTPWNDSLTSMLCRWGDDNLHVKVVKAIAGNFHDDCMGGFDYLNAQGVETIYGTRTLAICTKKGLPIAKTTFADSLNLDFNGMSLLLYYPGGGHTVDNIVVWLPSVKILFGGCLVKELHSTSIGNTADADLVAWPSSIRRVMARFPNAEIIVPGHGETGGNDLFTRTLELCSPNW
jgi:Zn-dependent hydrolases, including glyoxylases